jgi:chromatin remodeling complex protein RSC6
MVDEEINESDERLSQATTGILQTLGTFKHQITALQQQIRSLEKEMKKEMKQMRKASKKRKRNPNRAPSGFAKPTKISKELTTFLELEDNTEMARTQVTSHIIQYIKENDLQEKENRRIIRPDEKLKKLLNVKDEEEVTYFNLQRYMNPHFIKQKVESN